jgi:predicted ATPase
VNTPFFPVIDLLHQGLAWGADAKAEERLAGLERVLALMGLEPAQAVPVLAPLLGLPVPEGYPPLVLAPEAQRKRLLATLVAWVCGGARLQPMVIVTEDVHWADPSTLELDGLLVEQGATVPLLQVFTARPEFRPPCSPVSSARRKESSASAKRASGARPASAAACSLASAESGSSAYASSRS